MKVLGSKRVFLSEVKSHHGNKRLRELQVSLLDAIFKDDSTQYGFVACNFLTTYKRHFLGHDCRKVLKHVYKSYNFFRVVSVS